MQAEEDLVGVRLVVQLAETVDDLGAGEQANGVAGALVSLVEAVIERERLMRRVGGRRRAGGVQQIVPAVGGDRRAVDLLMDTAEFDDVVVLAGGIVDEVVGGS
ncbi:hypothetical protein [Streptomyces thermolineatus]|uniref:hypothetical protein n=1 Tax=Streptomyces thermolineatus TaxID=44033 RepID=UPI00384FC8D1